MSCRIFFTSRLHIPTTTFRFHPTRLNRAPSSFVVQQRLLSTLSSSAPKHTTPTLEADFVYNGPLTLTFRRLKIFSLSSLSLSCMLAPFMFLMESNLPTTARVVVASIAVGTSGLSTGLVGWCAKPYVAKLRRLVPEKHGDAEGIEMTTFDILLRPRITRVSHLYLYVLHAWLKTYRYTMQLF
jgi:TMEM70/TMEM186/TMEM223 protein family